MPLVIDTGSPVTVVDPGDLSGEGVLVRERSPVDLLTLGPAGTPVTRARFLTVAALVRNIGDIGLSGKRTPVPGVVLGADLLATLAVRLDPRAGRLFFFPNIAGASEVLGRACSAVFPVTRAGGGRFVLGTSELDFVPTRLVVGACLNPDAPPPLDMPSGRPTGGGTDALLVVATGLPVTVLSVSAWKRLTGEDVTGLATEGTLALPGAPPEDVDPTAVEHVWVRSLARLGLAADEQDRVGPCGELLTSRLMSLGGCATDEACPCQNDGQTCTAGASLEVVGPAATGLEVAIVRDESPLLQGLRNELRPDLADIDGLLGMNALAQVITDLDYPNGRLVFRCPDGVDNDTCVARPRIERGKRAQVEACLAPLRWTATP